MNPPSERQRQHVRATLAARLAEWALTIAVLSLAGAWLDWQYGTKPAATVAGAIAGIVGVAAFQARVASRKPDSRRVQRRPADPTHGESRPGGAG